MEEFLLLEMGSASQSSSGMVELYSVLTGVSRKFWKSTESISLMGNLITFSTADFSLHQTHSDQVI